MKNPIPDASTARRWNLLSDASSSAAIKSLARISVTASPRRSCRLPVPAAGRVLLRRMLSGPGNAPADLEMNAR